MSELKPCPFCGAMPMGEDDRYMCSTLGCVMQEDTISAKEWNTRPIEDALQARIAELEAAQRWIPVSERLPEPATCVLVYDAGGNMTVDFLVTSGDVEKYFWLAKCRILFWMPLPNPPEVQE